MSGVGSGEDRTPKERATFAFHAAAQDLVAACWQLGRSVSKRSQIPVGKAEDEVNAALVKLMAGAREYREAKR